MIAPGDIFIVITWLSLIFLLHLPLIPLFRKSFPLVGVPLSFSISILLFTLLSYWVVLLHLPLQASLLPFLLIGIFSIFRAGRYSIRSLSQSACSHLRSEWRYYALFGSVFLFMLLLRVYSPDISAAEKFMDHGFIASMMRSPMRRKGRSEA